MAAKLIQKDLFRGMQEFELVDDHVNVRMKPPFKKEESLTVMLTVLDPEPIISKSFLHFNSRVNGEPLLSLFLGKPNTETFNHFVGALKQQALEEFNAFAGLSSSTSPTGLNGNVFDEPVEFEDSEQEAIAEIRQEIDVARIDESIKMLGLHLQEDAEPLIMALKAVKQAPTNKTLLVELLHTFNELGPRQGAILTYAPYVAILLSDDPFS